MSEIISSFEKRVLSTQGYKLGKRLATFAAVLCDEEIQSEHFKHDITTEMYFTVGLGMLKQSIRQLGELLDPKVLEGSQKITSTYQHCNQNMAKSKTKTMKNIIMMFETNSIIDELSRKFKTLMDYEYNNSQGFLDAKHIKKILKAQEKHTSPPDKSKEAWLELYQEKLTQLGKVFLVNYPDVAAQFEELEFLTQWIKDRKMPSAVKCCVIELAVQLYVEKLKHWKNTQDLGNKVQHLANRIYHHNSCMVLVNNNQMSVTSRLKEKANRGQQSHEIIEKGIEYLTIIQARGEKMCVTMQRYLHQLVDTINSSGGKINTRAISSKLERDMRQIKGKYNTKIKKFFGDA